MLFCWSIFLVLIYTIILLKSVCRRSQTAGGNSCSFVSGDVSSESTSCHEFTSQFGLAIFLYAKNIQNLEEFGWPARVFILMTLLPAMNACGADRHGWAPTNSANLYGSDGGVCVCSCMCVHACMHRRACVMCLQCTIIIFDPG